VLLVRHGRTAANAAGVLAGWTPGISLDDTGRAQASALAQRMAVLPISLAVSSPLQRCQETAGVLLAEPGPIPRPELLTDDRLGECRYGDWTGKSLKDLVKEPLWRVVQAHPSAAVFPGDEGEAMLTMQHRAVSAIREYDARVAAEHGDDALWVAFSHGDVIKAILADALGMHLDAFQRLVVDPCSVSVVRYTPLRPFAVRVNDAGNDLAALVPPPPAKKGRARRPVSSDAVVGGSTGAAPSTGPAPRPVAKAPKAPTRAPVKRAAKAPAKTAARRPVKATSTGGSASGPGTT
jgi:probable phosphomutase (TIGR03848 family)